MLPLFSKHEDINFAKFFFDFALPNEAFRLDESFTKNWKSIQKWRDCNGCPNLEYLKRKFGKYF